MNPLFDIKVGDRVCCVWPKHPYLMGGYYTVSCVTGGYLQVHQLGVKYQGEDDFPEFFRQDRFVKMLDQPKVTKNWKHYLRGW